MKQKAEKEKLGPPNPIMEGIRNLVSFLLTNVDVTFEGLQHLKNINSPVVFAVGPHNGHTDTIFALRGIGKASHKIKSMTIALAAADYWGKEPRKTLSRLVMRTALLDREGGTQTNLDKQNIEQLIRNGIYPLVFPEGTRGRNPKKPVRDRKFLTGAVQLAVNTRDLNTEVVPIYLEGAEQVMSTGKLLPKFRPSRRKPKFQVRVIIGRPINVSAQIPENFNDLLPKQQHIILRQVTAQIQEYMVVMQQDQKHQSRKMPPY